MPSRRPNKTLSKRKATNGWSPDDHVVERVAEMMARRWNKGAMTEWICEYAGRQLGSKDRSGKFYHLPSRETTEKVFTLARESMQKRFDLDARYHKAMSVEFYETVIRDPASTPTERIRAQERIDNVMGIDAKFGSRTDTAEAMADKLRQATRLMQESISMMSPPAQEATDGV